MKEKNVVTTNAVIAIVIVIIALYWALSRISGIYATKDELSLYAKQEALSSFVEAGDLASALESYAMKEQLEGLDQSTDVAEVAAGIEGVRDSLGRVEGEVADLQGLAGQFEGLRMSQEDLTGRVASLPGPEAYQPPVGTVIASLLSESEFQGLFGKSWALADGRAVEGSGYEKLTGNKNVPDFRGVFLRGKNHDRANDSGNPDGDLTAGTFQGDALQEHTHSYSRGEKVPIIPLHLGSADQEHAHSYSRGKKTRKERRSSESSGGEDGGRGVPAPAKTMGVDREEGIRIGSETRPRNVTVNLFVRID